MSASVGDGVRASRAVAPITMPGVQKPHWKAWASMKARWTGCNRPSLASPSIVTTSRAREAGVTQARNARPSISTVQLPHWPSPQPYLVPDSIKCSRSTSSRLVSSGTSPDQGRPLTVSVSFAMGSMVRLPPRAAPDRTARAAEPWQHVQAHAAHSRCPCLRGDRRRLLRQRRAHPRGLPRFDERILAGRAAHVQSLLTPLAPGLTA